MEKNRGPLRKIVITILSRCAWSVSSQHKQVLAHEKKKKPHMGEYLASSLVLAPKIELFLPLMFP